MESLKEAARTILLSAEPTEKVRHSGLVAAAWRQGDLPLGGAVDMPDRPARPAQPVLLRPGAITREQLEAVLGRRVAVFKRPRRPREHVAQIAPGLLTRHYSPRTPVELHARLQPAAAARVPAEAFVFIQRPEGARGKNVFWFDETGDLRGVARQRPARPASGWGFRTSC